MDSKKLRIKILWLIVLYVGIVALFGLPYANKKIVVGTSYAKAIEETGYPKIFYSIRKFILKVGGFLSVMGCILIFSEDHLVKHYGSESNRKNISRLILSTIGVYTVVIIVQLVFAVVSLVITKQTQSVPLKEFSRADFVWLVGVTILAAYCLYSQIEWQRYLKTLEGK